MVSHCLLAIMFDDQNFNMKLSLSPLHNSVFYIYYRLLKSFLELYHEGHFEFI